MITVAEPTAAEFILSEVYALTHARVRRTAFKYAKTHPGPMSDPDDYTQNVFMRLLEWLGDPRHLEQAEDLIDHPSDCIRFMHSFARARICDHIDVNLARPRDQRLTIHASECRHHVVRGGIGDDSGPSLMDMLSHLPGNVDGTDGGENMVLAEIKKNVSPLAARLLDALVDPPKMVRAAFWESRIRISQGLAVLSQPDNRHDPYLLELSVREGYNLEDQTVSWHGTTFRNRALDTSLGPAVLSYPRRGLIMIRFESNLTVRLDRQSLEGEFLRESIRPSPRPFDVKIMADHLGSPMMRVRDAWVLLREALSDYLSPDDPELPLNV